MPNSVKQDTGHVMRPDTRTAMAQLIQQIRQAFPFDMPQAQLCAGPCSGCPKKLLEFLDSELDEWQSELERGAAPRLGDLQRLAKTARKIHRVLARNGLVTDAPRESR